MATSKKKPQQSKKVTKPATQRKKKPADDKNTRMMDSTQVPQSGTANGTGGVVQQPA